jgi:ATP-dependent Clp protease adaptor protein ClpS
MSTKEQTLERTEIKYPGQYNVIMHNDDETPMVFVVQLLIEVFGHSMDAARDIMMTVHQEDAAVAGTYNREVAYQKKKDVDQIANHNGYPLKATVESDD